MSRKSGYSFHLFNKTGTMRYLFSLLVLTTVLSCTKKFDPQITVGELKSEIGYLASDSLKGRKAGSEGDSLACNFIRNSFQDAGLQLLYNNGFQQFKIITDVTLGTGNKLSVNDRDLKVDTDFRPYSFSANSNLTAGLIFAGYGFDFHEDSISWNDYNGLDVTGKWVLVLKGDPEINKPESVFAGYSDERTKVLAASDHNAGGVIFVGGPIYAEEDELSPLFYDKNSSRYGIPVIQVTRAVADEILKSSGKTVAKLEMDLNDNLIPESFSTDALVSATVDVIQKQVETENVVGVLPGHDPALMDEYVIIGAHHDHLGMGGPGSGSRTPDTLAIHNGADDNASGVAAIIELAQKAAADKNNRRTLIFVSFGAEEMGLIGSRAFTNNPPVELSKVDAMFNFDMVGRLDTTTNSLTVGGTKTALETEDLLHNDNTGFELSLSGEGAGPSDHASFYLQGIPVFFITTGSHGDYHTPTDDADRINYEGEREVIKYGYKLISDVANRDGKLTFREAGSAERQGRGARYKITLGIMPDFAGIEKRGLRVDAVTKGKPAFNGGIKKGDIITAINGKKVGNIYDYMNRLNTLGSGQTISVDVLRGDKQVVLIIQL